MASNYTPNVGLCQWQRTDPFTLDDFNADNAKIDAALAAQPYQVLLTQTLAAEAEGLSLDVSGLDLSATPRLRVETTAPFYTVNNNHTIISPTMRAPTPATTGPIFTPAPYGTPRAATGC